MCHLETTITDQYYFYLYTSEGIRDLITMLERVTNEVIGYEPQGNRLQNSRQTPEVHSTLRGKVYFNTAGKCKCD